MPNEFIPYTGVEQVEATVAFMKKNGFGGITPTSIELEVLDGEMQVEKRYPLSTALRASIESSP
jgi:hypothetical protein